MTALAKGQLSFFALAVEFYVMSEFPRIAIPIIAALVGIAAFVLFRQYELSFSFLHGQLAALTAVVICFLFFNSGLPANMDRYLAFSFLVLGAVVCAVSAFRPFPNPRP
ncbi:MAG: hypothetical protein GVX90_03800 [Alphaproteobacteria bacterium]|nr:hypothetical protein [Alphaproteobacteria bacterium]